MKSFVPCTLFLFFALFFTFFDNCGAFQRPAVALFDDGRREIMSVTTWRELDFGSRSAVAGREKPAKVFAFLASYFFAGTGSHVSDANGKKDFFLIPYCSSIANNDIVVDDVKHSCLLSNYQGYVLLRFRGGWETRFSAVLWQDFMLTTEVNEALRHFSQVTNDSKISFPPFGKSLQNSFFDSGFVPRVEFIESCNDLTDECFQGRHMTYTTSFKEIPLEGFSGRMIFPVTFSGAWNNPWTLRLSAAMPHDSSTVVDILLVLVDKEVSFTWALWLGSAVLGNIFLFVACFLFVVLFILAVKELGFRLVEPVALMNERNDTVLYAEDISDDQVFLPFYRITLAFREIFWSGISQLFVYLRAFFRYFFCQPRRRWAEMRSNDNTGDVTLEGERVNFRTQEVCDNVNIENITVGTTDENSKEGNSDDDDDWFICRICHSKNPVEELFAPCACNGSSKYVHRSCLEKWRATTTNAEHRRVCAECKVPYVLQLERVTILSDAHFNSAVCVPVCRHYMYSAMMLLFFIFQLWAGGYYLKLSFYFFTGLDEGVVWSAANLYHWVLGIYTFVALSLNMWALEYVLRDFPKLWQQLLVLFISISVIEIPFSYVGQAICFRMINRFWSLEVSYGLGILITAAFSVILLPHIYVVLQSFSTIREVVAQRLGRTEDRIIL